MFCDEERHLITSIEIMLLEVRRELVDACVFHPLRSVLTDYEAWKDGNPTVYPALSRIETLHGIAKALELSR